MSDKMKKGIRKAAFIVGGMALGLAYYYFCLLYTSDAADEL